MSDNLFGKYHIPIIPSNVSMKSSTNDCSSIDFKTSSECSIDSTPLPINNDEQYQHPNRFIAPGRQGSNFTPINRANKRRLSGSIESTKSQKKPVIFGRDESYPEELNSLIKPLFCELCNAQLNSPKTANAHYQSKSHDKNIKAWLAHNYTEKGLDAPIVKRFYRGSGPVGPDAYHCECCDLKLTSKQNAEQHYTGRKHKLVLSKTSNPSGSGYYTPEGKWVRQSFKASSVRNNDGRFEIGEGFKHVSVEVTTNDITDDTHSVSKEKDLPSQVNPKIETSESLTCKLCNISVTSSYHMGIHLEGTKHRKKLKTSEDQTAVSVVKSTDTVLASLNETEIFPFDMSVYRTPTGSFYCKICDISMVHQSVLLQHLQGKKHIKKSAANSKDQAN